MQKEQPTHKENTIWSLLPEEILIKIFACADLETKEKLYFSCPEIFSLNINDILNCSPLVLSKKCHLNHMIDAAKNNDVEKFIHLLSNAAYCDDSNISKNSYPAFIVTSVSYLFDYGSAEEEAVDTYFEQHDSVIKEQGLQHILTVYQKYPDLIKSLFKKEYGTFVEQDKGGIRVF